MEKCIKSALKLAYEIWTKLGMEIVNVGSNYGNLEMGWATLGTEMS